ncbi:hypothetical protein ACFZCP_27335 [Streptomyces sp. NPDC007971]|uniref:hypothetical protein n=1 Tax=Streptomyces sp. NPDC007971 TaxID=3364799 RepID=UPI0036EAAEAE
MPDNEMQSARCHISSLRDRTDKLLADVLDRIDADGAVTEDGEPHPLLAAAAMLTDTGTNLRALALARRLGIGTLETRHARPEK